MAMSRFFALQSLLFLTITIFLPLTTNTKPRLLVTKLIYHDSIFSPFYNPNDTITDRAKRIVRNSNARFAYLQSKSNGAQADLIAENTGFLINFSIGNPPIPQLADMDTGSHFLWIRCKCKPCINCDKQQSSPVFDPSESSTYRNIPCHDYDCAMSSSFIPLPCELHDSNCKFSITYTDKTSSVGYVATEHLTFETPAEDMIVVKDVLFGCSMNSTKNDDRSSGVFGLGPQSSASIVDKLGSRFSYCIGNIHDPKYNFNQLVFGDGVILEGYATPFTRQLGSYYITLEGISLGQERLDIDPNVFQFRHGNGVLLDSGATLTRLPKVVYNIIKEKISSLLEGLLTQTPSSFRPADVLCYNGTVSRDLQGLPVMTFHFAQGADLVLDAGSLFYQEKSKVFCIAIDPIRPKIFAKNSIIGIMAQQYYNVGYDLKEGKIYFQRIDCELLDG